MNRSIWHGPFGSDRNARRHVSAQMDFAHGLLECMVRQPLRRLSHKLKVWSERREEHAEAMEEREFERRLKKAQEAQQPGGNGGNHDNLTGPLARKHGQ